MCVCASLCGPLLQVAQQVTHQQHLSALEQQRAQQAQILKTQYSVTSWSKYTRALTFQNSSSWQRWSSSEHSRCTTTTSSSIRPCSKRPCSSSSNISINVSSISNSSRVASTTAHQHCSSCRKCSCWERTPQTRASMALCCTRTRPQLPTSTLALHGVQ